MVWAVPQELPIYLEIFMYVERISVTEKAKEVIEQLREQHGELIFHQSGGCCDGSAPMCFEKGDFLHIR